MYVFLIDRATEFLLRCVKVCPADFLRTMGVEEELEKLAKDKENDC